MVRMDQDRPQTAPDATTQAIGIGANRHHGEEVVGCAWGGGAVSATGAVLRAPT